MVLAHTPMAPLSAKFCHENADQVLILGKQSCREVALSYGFKYPILSDEIHKACPDVWPFRTVKELSFDSQLQLDRKVGAILSFHDSPDWGLDIQIICDLLRANGDLRRIFEHEHRNHRKHHFVGQQQLPVYFSNGDFVWSNNLPLTRFAQGSFRHALEGVYSRLSGKRLEYIMYGKPHKSTYDFAKKAIDKHAAELYGPEAANIQRKYFGIGDNPESDIAGANGAGWTSVLVKTGVYDEGPHEANVLVEDVEQAVEAILSERLI
ncbi:hypothetical protein HDU82_004281 [Entophlyctis luteolus]|nr:hypothetical protein HDU82_004281 [Entophlyctis luteolus]